MLTFWTAPQPVTAVMTSRSMSPSYGEHRISISYFLTRTKLYILTEVVLYGTLRLPLYIFSLFHRSTYAQTDHIDKTKNEIDINHAMLVPLSINLVCAPLKAPITSHLMD